MTTRISPVLEQPSCESCGAPQPLRQRFAFTAVLMSSKELKKAGFPNIPVSMVWVIGRADEGEKGYTPISKEGIFSTETYARDQAKKMNAKIGWKDEGDAQMLVLRTIPALEDELKKLLKLTVSPLEILLRLAVKQDDRETRDELRELLADMKPYVGK